jgi:oxygen-independent coproporphyrinogen-3 oxidase
VAGRDDLIDDYLDCLEIELSQRLPSPWPVQTLFLGGGTPTHLPTDRLRRLLELLGHWLPVQSGGEYSVEANPLDCTESCLTDLRCAGVNRLSLGGQSFDDEKLQTLQRDHNGSQLLAVLDMAKDHFQNLSLDLIFGVPGESLDQWRQDVCMALDSPIVHLSTYGLTIERGANFYGRTLRGGLCELDSETQLSMYLHTIERLTSAGWQHYEVSNFSKPNYACRHNQVYWQGQYWWGFGPGAASFLPTAIAKDSLPQDKTVRPILPKPEYSEAVRVTNHRSTTQYLRRLQQGISPIAEREPIDSQQAIRERLVFGLRQRAGIDLGELDAMYGGDASQLFKPYLARFLELGYLEQSGTQLRLTQSGLVISDSLWPDLLG